MSNANSARPTFQASGRVDWLRFLSISPMLGALIIVATAAGLAFFRWVNFYLIVIMPIIAGVGAGLAMYGAIKTIHCRSWFLASLCGLAVGSFAFLYSFQLYAALHDRVWEAVFTIWELPHIINAIVSTTVIGEVGKANNNAQPSPVMNWILFAFEWICCAGATAGIAGTASQAGYCERCLRWMTVRDVKTGPGAAQAVAIALANPANTHDQIAALPEITTAPTDTDHASFQLEGCTHNGAFDEATFFLTANEIAGTGENQKTITLLQKVALTPDEFALLATKIPAFAATK